MVRVALVHKRVEILSCFPYASFAVSKGEVLFFLRENKIERLQSMILFVKLGNRRYSGSVIVTKFGFVLAFAITAGDEVTPWFFDRQPIRRFRQGRVCHGRKDLRGISFR